MDNLKGPSHQVRFSWKWYQSIWLAEDIWCWTVKNFPWILTAQSYLAIHSNCSPIHFFTGWELVLAFAAFWFPLSVLYFIPLALWPIRICPQLSLFIFPVSYWLNVLLCPVPAPGGLGVQLVSHFLHSTGNRRNLPMITWWIQVALPATLLRPVQLPLQLKGRGI